MTDTRRYKTQVRRSFALQLTDDRMLITILYVQRSEKQYRLHN